MIPKLRRKIFWSIELSAMGILLLILVFLNAASAVNSERENRQMMSVFMTSVTGQGSNGHERGKAAGAVKALMDDALCAVELDKDGNIVSVTGSSALADGELSSLLQRILSGGKSCGRAGSVRYLVSESGSGKVVVLSSYGFISSGTAQTALISLGGLLAAGLLFAVLARSLSGRIVRPVEETLEEQKRFIADAGHELKTPVTVINANIDVLEKESGQNRWLDFIREEGERLSALVGSLLEFVRMDCAQDNAPPPELFDAAAAVTEAALPFESVAFEAGIDCAFDIPDSARAFGRGEDLKQIVGILLDNAIRHTEPGGSVRLCAGVEKRRKKLREESKFVLSVSNTGDEIPAQALPLLFRRFYQVDPSRQYKGSSFGLGLAIAHSLAERNSGDITVASAERLTVFTVEFPVR